MGGGTETDCHKMLPLPRLLSKTGSGIRGHAYAPVLINLSVSLFASLSPDGSGWEILISSTVLENTASLDGERLFSFRHYRDTHRPTSFHEEKFIPRVFYHARMQVARKGERKRGLFEKVDFSQAFRASFRLLPFPSLKSSIIASPFPHKVNF